MAATPKKTTVRRKSGKKSGKARANAKKKPKAPDELIHQWNTAGRQHMRQLNAALEALKKRWRPESPVADRGTLEKWLKKWPTEPRKLEAAEAIMTLAETADREGRWRPDYPIADRVYEPGWVFADRMFDVQQGLKYVTILGPDEFLVRLGSSFAPHRPRPVLHLRGGEVRELPGVLAVAASRSHDLLLFVREDGFSVSRGLDEAPVRHFPWPDGMSPAAFDSLQLSNDGLTIAFVLNREAVWLGQAADAAPVWTRVHPSDALLAEIAEEEYTKDRFLHCALSPDGRFIACGSQFYGHVIDRIEGVAAVRRWAKIGHRSKYPCYAWFSDDGARAALSSCDFNGRGYNGASLGVRLSEIENISTEPYAENKHTTLIDDEPVYAAAWLPLGPQKDGFVLAGEDYLNIVSSDGTLRSSTHFGYPASSIDYCPKTGIVALGSHSGFLHVFDPNRQAETDQAIGYRPIREVYRWVLWKNRAPFRW